jgi:hypothetical protein
MSPLHPFFAIACIMWNGRFCPQRIYAGKRLDHHIVDTKTATDLGDGKVSIRNFPENPHDIAAICSSRQQGLTPLQIFHQPQCVVDRGMRIAR